MIAFIASFPDFWALLLEPTRMALQATIDNADAATIADHRILTGVTLPHSRAPLLAVIAALNGEHLANAIAMQPLAALWPRAVTLYQGSGSWRGSEASFRDLISPFAGRLASQQIDQLLDAIIENSQNWGAAETDTLLLEIPRNAEAAEQPTPDARNRFCQHVRGVRRTDKYDEVLTFFSDRWLGATSARTGRRPISLIRFTLYLRTSELV